MFKSLYFKIVLILFIFIVAVMSAVSAILMNSVSAHYMQEFGAQMEECLGEGTILRYELAQAANGENAPEAMRAILASYGSILGIDQYRNYYILNPDGETLAASDAVLGESLEITPNLLSAIRGEQNNRVISGADSADWAIRLDGGDDTYILYIQDSMEEMRQLNQVLFSIILQAMFVGILIAILLSFFLAKAITAPIQRLTEGTQRVAAGDFTQPIQVNSRDELGVLTENFNYMKEQLKETLTEVSGEREKLETVLACMRDPVLTFAATGRLLHRNTSAGELLEQIRRGQTPAIGESMPEVTLEDCFAAMDIPLRLENKVIRLTEPEAAVERSRDGFVFRDRSFAGRVYDVSLGVIRYVENGRMVPGCILVAHDVTGRFELDESRREFVANVSHELRTPLTAIKGATETILSDGEMEEADREYFLEMILSESDRMTRIVSDLLVLSRLDNKRTRWNIESFDFAATVSRLCDVMHTDFEAHHHTVTLDTVPDMPMITGDRQRIEQVLINILSNAVKYTPDGGKIHVSLSHGDTSVAVEIEDNGIGIPDKDIAHLFERFYRVEKSRTTDAGGTGLGLAIAKELVEAHGGKITVRSRLEEGTCVRVELPIVCKLKNTP